VSCRSLRKNRAATLKVSGSPRADIDRNNASQARLAGFERDLGLKGEEFATVLSIVYGEPSILMPRNADRRAYPGCCFARPVGYILMQVPSNMILSKISYPSWYIAAAMLIWGMIVSSCSQRRARLLPELGELSTDSFHVACSLSSLVSAATLPMSSSRGSSSVSSSQFRVSQLSSVPGRMLINPPLLFPEPSSCPEPCSC
jgi:hypothetical protein